MKPEAVQKQQAGPAAAAAAVHHHASIQSKYEIGTTSGGGGVDKPMAWMKNATNDEAVAGMAAEAEMELDIQKKTWDASHRCRSRSRSRHIMERAR